MSNVHFVIGGHLQVFLHIQNNKSFLNLSGEDIAKSNCEEKGKQATF